MTPVDPSVVISVIAAGGTVVGAILSYLAVRFTQRSATAAAEASNRLERTKVDAAAYDSAKETWQEHVSSLKERVAELVVRVEQLETQRQRDAERIRELQLEQERDRGLIRELSTWARLVLPLLDDRGITYPPPPAGLAHGG